MYLCQGAGDSRVALMARLSSASCTCWTCTGSSPSQHSSFLPTPVHTLLETSAAQAKAGTAFSPRTCVGLDRVLGHLLGLVQGRFFSCFQQWMLSVFISTSEGSTRLAELSQASLGWVLPQLMEGYLGLAAGQVQDSSHFSSIRTAPMKVT